MQDDTSPTPATRRTPGPRGREQLNALSRLADDLYEGLDRLRAQYGPAFRIGMGRTQVLWLASPSAAETILRTPPADLTMRKAYSFLEPVGGHGALIATDGAPHDLRRADLTKRFYGGSGTTWVDRLDARFEPWLDAYVNAASVPSFLDAVRPLLLDAVVDAMVGRSALAADAVWKGRMMALMEHATRSIGEQLMRVPLPGTSWASFLSTRREVDRALYATIDARLSSPEPHDDEADVLDLVVSMAQRGRYNEKAFRRGIRDEIMGLISAGFETTASAATWAVAYAQTEPLWGPELKRRLREQTLSDTLSDPWVDAFVSEVLRLRPPAPVMLRRAVRRTRIDGHVVPQGSLVAFTVWLLHRDADLHADPHTFKPGRFLEDPPTRWSYLPFGYGARYCIGGPMAKALVKGLLHRLYQATDVVGGPYDLKPTGLSLRPASNLELTLTSTQTGAHFL